MATHVRPSLAPALVAPRLLGLLARPTATYLCKLQRGPTGASCTSPAFVAPRLLGRAMRVWPTLAQAFVALRLMGRLARQLALVCVQVATQASL